MRLPARMTECNHSVGRGSEVVVHLKINTFSKNGARLAQVVRARH